jgi:hypothetical protein
MSVVANIAMSLDGFIADADYRCGGDHTNGWGGHLPREVPMVVLIHHALDDWPRDGVPIQFASGVEAAVGRAVEPAGDMDVSVAGATAAGECLDAGLLDLIDVSLVPVSGRPPAGPPTAAEARRGGTDGRHPVGPPTLGGLANHEHDVIGGDSRCQK